MSEGSPQARPAITVSSAPCTVSGRPLRALAAGLILEDRFFQIDVKSPEGGQSVESLLAPLEQLFAPLFFVLLGFQVDVTTFANLKVLLLGLLLTLVAIFGKMAATLILFCASATIFWPDATFPGGPSRSPSSC